MIITGNRPFILVFLLIQILSLKNPAQNALPISKGNEWYYTIDYYFHYPPVPPTSFRFSITGDTIMPNGKHYMIIEPMDMFQERYIRSDSQYVYYYWADNNDSSADRRIFNIHALPGTSDTIEWDFSLITAGDPIQSALFGKQATIYNFQLEGLIFGDIVLSKEFGYVHYEYRGDYPGTPDVWTLKGCIISDTLYGTITDVHLENNPPEDFELFQNYPNPFNPATKIEFIIPSNDLVTLSIYNSLGQLTETLVRKELAAGRYTVYWNASEYSSGMYYYKIESG